MSDARAPVSLSRPPRGDLILLAVAVAAVSTSAPLIREAAVPALAIAFWRNALATLAMVPMLVAQSRRLRSLTRREVLLAVGAGALLGAHFAFWIPSLSFTSVASSVSLVATQPVWAALLAKARGHQIPRRAWLGIGVALLGVVAITGVDVNVSARAVLGDGLALAGGMLAALYITVGAEVRTTVSTTIYTSLCYSVAAGALLAACLLTGQRLGGYSSKSWWCILALTVGAQLLGHSLVNKVLRTTSPTLVSVAILFEVVGATVLAAWWFGEQPHAGTVPAAALIVLGVVVVVRAGTPAAATD